MSYILDALKRSEQKRRQGAVPDLLTVPDIAARQPKKRYLWLSLLVAALAVNAGLLLWWLRPWQQTKPVMTVKVPVRHEAVVPTPQPPSSESRVREEMKAPLKKPEPAHDGEKPHKTEARELPAQDRSSEAAALPPEKAGLNRKTPDMGELPPAMQQELANLAVSGHFYSGRPDQRLVSVNGKIMREGQTTGTGLKLERITPDGVVFSYQGYRFSKGIF